MGQARRSSITLTIPSVLERKGARPDALLGWLCYSRSDIAVIPFISFLSLVSEGLDFARLGNPCVYSSLLMHNPLQSIEVPLF